MKSENLLFYAVSLLHGLIDDEFLKQFAQFVKIVKKLSGKFVLQNDISQATRIMENFYITLSNFFKPQNITVSIHGIIHLPKYIKLCGPFWVLSGFICENETGIWRRNVTGNSSSQEFMIFMYSIKLKIFASNFQRILEKQSESMINLLRDVAPFLLDSNEEKKKGRTKLPGYQDCFVHGIAKKHKLNDEEKKAIKNEFKIEKHELLVYSKISSPLGIFSSSCHVSKLAKKKDSSWIQIESDFENQVGRILHFFHMKEKMWILTEIHSLSKIDEFGRSLVEKDKHELSILGIANIKSSLIMLDKGEIIDQKKVVEIVPYSKPTTAESFVSQS